jgi:transglutaminase/protease-like cytokinesis protein 3
MRDILKISFLLFALIITFLFRDTIATFITDEIIYKGSNKVLTYNEYYVENNYLYVQNTDISYATNYQDILNIFYTIINSGDDCFSFYCDYDNCMNDVRNITNDKNIISNINNFVHPYNSFDSINIDISSNEKITVKIKKIYNEEQIEFINTYINNFVDTNINLSMNNYDKIKVFHDHIINKTKYDENNTFESYTAYNLITSGISICGGYSDVMAIYLNHLGINNYKITSNNHIWNLVELDGVWYHLDVTWDDPVASDGNQYLIHNFFMISTSKLFELDKVEHNFDTKTYLEAKEQKSK